VRQQRGLQEREVGAVGDDAAVQRRVVTQRLWSAHPGQLAGGARLRRNLIHRVNYPKVQRERQRSTLRQRAPHALGDALVSAVPRKPLSL
jgi:hypothetical protein